MTNKDVYIAKMKMQLDELDGQMSVLEARAKEAKDDARAKYEEEMAKLHEQSKLALDPAPRAAAVGFAGATLLVEPLPDGVRLHVDHPQAAHLWHWLITATHTAKDQP